MLPVLLFLLNGCALNRLFLFNEIDKVNVVRYTSYVKHYRAYFARTDLKPVIDKRKYLFLYNDKKHDLALLLKRNAYYYLYSFTSPDHPAKKLKSRGKISRKYLLRYFAKMGYRVADLARLGFSARAGLRRYKSVKTLMIAVKDYRKLKALYESAIRHYDAGRVRYIRTPLPKKFITSYFIYYYKRATTADQKKTLREIADKLRIVLPDGNPLAKKETPKQDEESSNTAIDPEEANLESINNTDTIATSRPYLYYLHHASLYELSNYLDDPQNRRTLSYAQHHTLKQRLAALQEEQLLRDSSLEKLISAYKKNKKPRFKQRIMELLKEKQEEKLRN